MRPLFTVVLGIAGWVSSLAACPIPLEPNRTSFSATVYIGSNGPFRFLVDTGTTITLIDRAVAERIGVQPTRSLTAVSTTGGLDVQEATVRDLRAGDVSVPETTVLIADLPRFTNHGHLDGILGMSFFAGRSMLLDIRHRCLQVDVAPPVGIVLDAHEVVGRVAIESEGMNLVLDSGASFAVLTSPRARALAVEDGVADLKSAAGMRRTAAATIPRLRFGRVVLRNIAAAIAPRNDPREDGLLPINLFESVYIAADRKSVILR